MIWLYGTVDANGVVIFTHITLKEDFLIIYIEEKSFHSCIQKGGKREEAPSTSKITGNKKRSECMFKYSEKSVGFVPNTQHYYWS